MTMFVHSCIKEGPITTQSKLLEIIQMISEKVTKPALVVGIPVGFVAAAESKEKLQTSDVPFITNVGRKGGSSCAASIVNALYKLLRESS